VTFFGINRCVNLQVNVAMSVSVDGALDGFLRGDLGSRSVRAVGSSEVDDVSSADVVDETVDVNRLERSARISTTVSGRRSAVLSLLLSNVGIPVLSHHGADDNVEQRNLDVLLDESTESGVIERWRVDGGLVHVSFAVRDDLRAAGVQVSVTNRVNPTLNRTAREIVGRIRLGQHCSLDTATSVVTHDDDVSDAQRLNTVRQNADHVVVDGLELVRDVPLGEEGAWWRRKDRTLQHSGITASQE